MARKKKDQPIDFLADMNMTDPEPELKDAMRNLRKSRKSPAAPPPASPASNPPAPPNPPPRI